MHNSSYKKNLRKKHWTYKLEILDIMVHVNLSAYYIENKKANIVIII